MHRVDVVDGHADLIGEGVTGAVDERMGEEERVPDDPVVRIFGLPFNQSALVDPVLEEVAGDL